MFDFDLIKDLYENLSERVDFAKSILKRPLTYSEKILYSHLFENNFDSEYIRSKSYVEFSLIELQCRTQQLKWHYCNL